MTDVDTVIDKLLEDGLDDWTMLSNVVGTVSQACVGDPSRTQALCIRVIRELLTERLMTPGDLGNDGFKPWNMTPEDEVELIIAKADSVNWEVVSNLIIWFDNTEKGDERARVRGGDRQK